MQMQPKKAANFDQELADIQRSLGNLVIGQDPVLSQIVNSFSRIISGLADSERCLLSLMLLGPTGVGKTETIRVLAEIIFGNRRAFTRINCQEYNAHWNISKLLGSPPGYVDSDVKPLLSQENLDRHFHEARKNRAGLISDATSRLARSYIGDDGRALSILLFDEIEKAHPKVWNALLSIIEDGSIILGRNEEVDFSNTIVFCTSNVGGKAMSDAISGRTIGFDVGKNNDDLGKELRKRALREARRVFPPELLNRMDEIATFNFLSHEDLLDILDILISRARGRIYTCHAPFLLDLTSSARNSLVQKAVAQNEYGARPLRRALEQEVMTPISHHICSGEIVAGDHVTVDIEDNHQFVFNIADGMKSSSHHGIIMPTPRKPLSSQIEEDDSEQQKLPEIRRKEE